MWPALKGPNYSITAGEPSEPRGDASHPLMPPALKGPNYSVTAGERSEPAEGGAHHLRPQGGRTTTRNDRRNISAARHALTRRPRRWTPMGPSSPLTVFRGFATLTRGYRIVRPRWGRRPRGSTRPDRCVTPYPLRERSEPAEDASHPPMWPALKGPNYSITAGERSEPCGRRCTPSAAPRGSNHNEERPQEHLRSQTCTDASPQALDPYGALISFDGLPRVRYAHPRL